MASGGSYTLKDGERVLKQRSGHNIPAQPAPAATTKKVKADENKKEGVAGRG